MSCGLSATGELRALIPADAGALGITTAVSGDASSRRLWRGSVQADPSRTNWLRMVKSNGFAMKVAPASVAALMVPSSL